MTQILGTAPQSQSRSRAWYRRKHARPSEILKAAWERFRKDGYAETSVADIAHLAGIIKVPSIFTIRTRKPSSKR